MKKKKVRPKIVVDFRGHGDETLNHKTLKWLTNGELVAPSYRNKEPSRFLLHGE